MSKFLKMRKAHELGADVVSLLHIAPAHNRDFMTITSPKLLPLGESATSVWSKLVKSPDRFARRSTEEIFGKFLVKEYPELNEWRNYITARYAWVTE